MKKTIIRIVVLIVVFILTILIVNGIYNLGMNNLTAEMDNPSLPLVYVNYENTLINCLHGYKTEMNVSVMKESVTPMDDTKTIEMWIDDTNNNCDGYEYELRAINGGTLIEKGSLEDTVKEQGYTKLKTSLRMDIDADMEYMFILKLMNGEDVDARYYTRVYVGSDMHVPEILGVVDQFSTCSYDKVEAEKNIASRMEPTNSGNNENLSSIDIHSNFETITYAGLNPMRISQAIPTIKEVCGDFTCIELKYLSIAKSDGKIDGFYVTEQYRVKYMDQNTIYILDYTREMEEVFKPDNINTNKNWFRMGISNLTDFQYKTSDENTKIAFVKDGQLWYYDYLNATITQVFSFWQGDYTDSINSYDRHDIKIMDLDDDGNIAFVVYGYMNRGKHEGQQGMCLYRYDSKSYKLDEICFVESDKVFEILKENVEKLAYLNSDNIFYFVMDEGIYSLDTATKKITQISYDIPLRYISVSNNQHIIAYPDKGDPSLASCINVLNLDTGSNETIECAESQHIEALGIIEDDLIIGTANAQDIVNNPDGTVVFPMSQVTIYDKDRNVVKEYSKSGYYVISSSVDGNIVYLKRVTKEGNMVKEAEDDFITYKEDDNSEKVSVTYKATTDRYNQLFMIIPSNIYLKKMPKLIMSKELLEDEDNSLQLESATSVNKFYMYAGGRYMGTYDTSQNAIKEASGVSGTVINQEGTVLWRRIALVEYNTVTDNIDRRMADTPEDTFAACVYMLGTYEGNTVDVENVKADVASGMNYADIISKYTGRTGVNISGNDLETCLYYLCKNMPFIAYIDGHYVLVTSFNGARVRFIDPAYEEDIKLTREEYQRRLDAGGDVIYTYVGRDVQLQVPIEQ